MANYEDDRRRQYRQDQGDWNEARNRNLNDPYRYSENASSFGNTGYDYEDYQNRGHQQQQGFQGAGAYRDAGSRLEYGYNDNMRYQEWLQQKSGQHQQSSNPQGSYDMDVNPGGYSHYDDRGGFGQNAYGNNYNQNDRYEPRQQYGQGQQSGNYGSAGQGDNWQQQHSNKANRGYRSSQRGGFGATGNTYVDDRQYNKNQDWRLNYESNDYRKDRDWWERTKDEVSSWFGDSSAQRRRKIDDITEHHRGKGPSEYKRSENRIREDVCERLTDDEIVDATNITVQVQGEEVILSGTVHTREEKRRAEDVVESVSGVRNVENRIRIDRFGDSSNYNR